MESSYIPFGLSTHEHLLPGGRFPDEKPYVKQETCGPACVCKKCCALQESFHSAQIEQAKATRKSWEEAEKAAFKRQEAQKEKAEDSKKIARLETMIAEQQNCLSECKHASVKNYKKIARLEIQIAELQKRVSELEPSASPEVKRSYMIRGILY
jgi:uncharacterized coiled-coil protein SlyX